MYTSIVNTYIELTVLAIETQGWRETAMKKILQKVCVLYGNEIKQLLKVLSNNDAN